MSGANIPGAPLPALEGQDSVFGLQQGGGAVPAAESREAAPAAVPANSMQGILAAGGIVTLPMVSTMEELAGKGFVLDDFLDSEDFEHAVIAMTEWIRDTARVFVSWGLWQQLMKQLSEIYVEDSPARGDPELSRKISLLRVRAHEIVYGRLWRRNKVLSPAERSPLAYPLLATVGQKGRDVVPGSQQSRDGVLAIGSPVTEAALREHQALGATEFLRAGLQSPDREDMDRHVSMLSDERLRGIHKAFGARLSTHTS